MRRLSVAQAKAQLSALLEAVEITRRRRVRATACAVPAAGYPGV